MVASASSGTDSTTALYRDAALCFREIGDFELAETAGWLAYGAADPYDETHGLVCAERLRAAKDELARRARLHGAGADVPDPKGARYDAWRDLAQRVKDQADILDVFDRGGYHLSRAGRAEYCGACLVCAGTDRLRVGPGPPGRYWCRRCGLTGDVITAARNLLPDRCPGFASAVAYLAGECGLPLPAGEGRRR